ncbi:hypothetical protein [Pseudactinotalea suaedae]|uniref:hypothetical protein n=1 Tax=Pseudactinotalea suaedae TaxID=1524924 RepID=UPI0012E1B1DB|nr:hypothetical protein [Pseudactinotalea suaedae]
MSIFHGQQGPGAMRRHRAKKRQEAVQRSERAAIARNLTCLADEARQRSQPAGQVLITITAVTAGFAAEMDRVVRALSPEGTNP